MPTSFSVFVKVDLKLGLKHLFAMLSGFGNSHVKAVYCRGPGLWGWVFSQLGTSLCCWAYSGQWWMLSDYCWKARPVPPLESPGRCWLFII